MNRIMRVILLLALLLVCLGPAAIASEKVAEGRGDNTVSIGPYDGGIRLSAGGGEPGKAYMALVRVCPQTTVFLISEQKTVPAVPGQFRILVRILQKPCCRHIFHGFGRGYPFILLL